MSGRTESWVDRDSSTAKQIEKVAKSRIQMIRFIIFKS